MIIGYAAIEPAAAGATATDPHNALIAAGVQRLFIDVAMADLPRAQLDAAIGAMGPGDVLLGASIETMVRSSRDLVELVQRLDARGGVLRVLRMALGGPLDTGTVEGRAMIGALAVMQAFAPPLRATRGVLSGEARPRGRPATVGAQSAEVARLHAEGLKAVDIANRLGIGRASVYRILSQGGPLPEAAVRDPSVGRATFLARRLAQGAT